MRQCVGAPFGSRRGVVHDRCEHIGECVGIVRRDQPSSRTRGVEVDHRREAAAAARDDGEANRHRLERNDPEVLGILGRVYKDRWKATGADADLREATRAYAQAFALQPTDYYAGFNAASLLFLQATPEANADLARLLPRVNTLVVDRLGQKGPDDFWAINVATELAIIGRNWSAAREFAQRQVASRPDPWMLTVEIESLQRLGRRLTGPDSDALSQVVAILTAATGPTGAPRA